jgi:CubicO group peptidase (beta-lactamase class C family)
MNKTGLIESIEKIRIENRAVAVQVGVIRDGEVIFNGGSGFEELENKIESDTETIFGIGSATKAFVAGALAILVDEKKVDWDTSIRTYIPEFEMYDSYVSEHLTVRDILCHRSGLPRHDYMWYANMDTITEKDIMDRLKHLKPNNRFRYEMQYQNHMYFLAGQLVRRITGQSWDDFVKERIFKPLGMHDTNCSMTVSKDLERMANAYEFVDKEAKLIPHKNIDIIGSAGSINSNVKDMMKWVELNINKGKWKDKQIISEENINECHSPQMIVKNMFPWKFDEVDFQNYGIGWFVESYKGHKVIHHGGSIDGFQTMVSFIPEINAGFSILTSGSGNIVPMILQNMLYDRLLGLYESDWNMKFNDEIDKTKSKAKDQIKQFFDAAEKGTTPTQNLDAYAGTYENEAYGEVAIVLEDDGSLREKATHLCYDSFALHDEEKMFFMPLQFNIDMHGKITGVEIKMEPTLNEMIKFSKK